VARADPRLRGCDLRSTRMTDDEKWQAIAERMRFDVQTRFRGKWGAPACYGIPAARAIRCYDAFASEFGEHRVRILVKRTAGGDPDGPPEFMLVPPDWIRRALATVH
jgi:hypothetical protein